MRYFNQRRRGLSLAETAITLGIVAIVAAGVWQAVSAVHRRRLVEQAVSDIGIIASNVRAVYQGQVDAALPTFSQLACAGIFPLNTIKKPSASAACSSWSTVGPWGGTYGVSFAYTSSQKYSYTVGFRGANGGLLPNEACLQVLEQLNPVSSTSVAFNATSLSGGITLPILSSSIVPQGDTAGNPLRVFVLVNDGNWVDVTGKKPTVVMTSTVGTGHCTGIAAAYPL
jgi:hypothetical protein